MDKDKEFIEWLETQDFFTKFVSENPDRLCWIRIAYFDSSGCDIRVHYVPKEPKERILRRRWHTL